MSDLIAGTHNDVWIIDDLKTIAVYYPEIEEERSILNSGTVFVDYLSAIHETIGAFISKCNQPGIIVHDEAWKEKHNGIPFPCSNIENAKKIDPTSFRNSYDWVKKFIAWKKYLIKTKSKPGNIIYNPEVFDNLLSDDGNIEINDGASKYIFPSLINNDTISNKETAITSGWLNLDDDSVAKTFCPLSYYPPNFESDQVFYDPNSIEDNNKLTRWYTPVVVSVIRNLNRKIYYKDIIKCVGYTITVDWSMFGFGTYTIPFDELMEAWIDPISFLKRKARAIVNDGLASLLFRVTNQNGQTYTFSYTDYAIFNYKWVSQILISHRESWIEVMVFGDRIPLPGEVFIDIGHREKVSACIKDPCDGKLFRRPGWALGTTTPGAFVQSLVVPNYERKPNDVDLVWTETQDVPWYEDFLQLLNVAITFGVSLLKGDLTSAFATTANYLFSQLVDISGLPTLAKTCLNSGLTEATSYTIKKYSSLGKSEQKAKSAKDLTNMLVMVSNSLGQPVDEDTTSFQSDAMIEDLMGEKNERIVSIMAAIAEQKKDVENIHFKVEGKQKEASIQQGFSKADNTMLTIQDKSGNGWILPTAALAAVLLLLKSK